MDDIVKKDHSEILDAVKNIDPEDMRFVLHIECIPGSNGELQNIATLEGKGIGLLQALSVFLEKRPDMIPVFEMTIDFTKKKLEGKI